MTQRPFAWTASLALQAFLVMSLVASRLPAAAQTKDQGTAKVELQIVKYKDLCAAVRAQRGKVVVVDLWADWCIPCKMAFPHLVQLHQRYAKDGLVCISVALMGDLQEVKDKDKVLAFLQKQQATFPNFFLEEEPALWQEKFDINGPPAIFVFNRDNKRAAKFDHNDPNRQYDEHDVEKVVKELLAAK